jgi:hypothetical protein
MQLKETVPEKILLRTEDKDTRGDTVRKLTLIRAAGGIYDFQNFEEV